MTINEVRAKAILKMLKKTRRLAQEGHCGHGVFCLWLREVVEELQIANGPLFWMEKCIRDKAPRH